MITTPMVDAAAMHLLRVDPEHEKALTEAGMTSEDFQRSAWDGLDEGVKHSLRSAALDMLNAAVAAGGTELQGATNEGEEAAWPKTAGEFAFRWNTLDDNARNMMVAAIEKLSTENAMLKMHARRS